MDEFICDKCNGTGIYPPVLEDIQHMQTTCDKCWGAKKLDWIEYIVGKPCPWDDASNSNVAIGYKAGYHQTGNSNIYIGYEAGVSNHTGNKNIMIGSNAGIKNGKI